VLFMLLEVKIK